MDLIFPFDTDHPEYARGFEAGRLWALLRSDPGELEETVHASNTEMVLRMAEAVGRDVTGEMLDDTWTLVTVEACDPERLGASPGGPQ